MLLVVSSEQIYNRVDVNATDIRPARKSDNMGIDLGKMLADATKSVSDFLVKTGDDITKAIDQNGDGKLDISDIQTVLDRNQAARNESQRKADLERLKPLFQEDFERAEFVMPKMIRIAEIDKPHADNPVCKGSVGFRTVLDDLSAITIYRDQIDQFGLSFYPELDNGVYYIDPCDRDHYVLLDDYFTFMKMQRVAELQRIAQSLGAKHFRVTYKEKSQSVSSSTVDVSASVKQKAVKADSGAQQNVINSLTDAISIEAEMRFPGHAPVRPVLHYLKKEINVTNLIEMRMDPLSPLQHQRFNLEMSNTSGIKVKDALKINAMLQTMKVTTNISVVTEAQNEARRILEYDIEF